MPDFRHYVRHNLPILRVSGAREVEIVEELALEVQEIYECALRGGMTSEEAWALVRVRVHSWDDLGVELGLTKREHILSGLWDEVARDLRYAARQIWKSPAFTIISVMTLALGIGATTAVFSIVDAVLLKPLPYKNPSRLVAIWITSTREKALAKLFALHGDYVEFRRHAHSLEDVAAATWARGNCCVLTGYGLSREVVAIPASASFFSMLGVEAAIGRTFRAADEGHGCSVLLSHQFWTSTFDRDSSIVGKSIDLDQKPCTVLGVMPSEFGFYPRQTEAWILLGPNYAPDQDRMLVGIFARLRPGVTASQAQAELRSLFRAIHPGLETQDFQPVVYDLQGEFTFLAGRTLRTTLIIVFGAVLLVLLIACLNVANLLVARLSERQRELTIRAALGSGRSRLVRQLLTEGLLLSILGTGAGVAIAYASVAYFRYASPVELTVGADVRVNLTVLLFGGALSIATTLIFGLLPALRASRVDLAQTLQGGGRGTALGKRGLIRSVSAIEMALSFVLLVGAGLLMASALRMGSEPLGFKPSGVLATRVSLPASRYSTEARRTRLYDQLLERLQRIPGAAGAALASKVPPDAGGNQTLEIRGRFAAQENHDVGADAITPGFFNLLGIPLDRGRGFEAQDRQDSQPVAIVNEALVRAYFQNSDPLGQQIRIPGGPNPQLAMPWLTIVGVVGNLKHTQLMNEMSWVETPIFYRPLAQEPRPAIQVALRTWGDPAGVARQIQEQIGAVDSSIPLVEVETLTSRLSKTLAYPRFRAAVLGCFAVSALLLSAVGLHGVLSQLVALRTREFGVRRAVGAQTRDVLWLVARQGGLPVLAGLGVGMCLTIAFSRVLSSLLYGIHAADPRIFTLVALALLLVAGLAILAPARRADPVIALRDE